MAADPTVVARRQLPKIETAVKIDQFKFYVKSVSSTPQCNIGT